MEAFPGSEFKRGFYGMEFDDFAQPEVGVAVAITAVAASPSVRKTLRKGAAYGLAGVLLAGDAAHRFVNAIAKGARHATTPSDTVVVLAPSGDAAADGVHDA
jgi:2-polyprenyl-6-methoxyphenol hydroxylase-like FAD-dependent oxidoreductase